MPRASKQAAIPPKWIRSIARYIVKTLAKGRETRASRSISKKIDIKETPCKDKYYEKSANMACAGAKTRDVGRQAYGDIGRKNPGPYKPINKAIYTEPVL